MAQKDRYRVSWLKPNKEWEEVTAKTYNEGKAYYDMLERADCLFKVMYDIVSGDQFFQEDYTNIGY